VATKTASKARVASGTSQKTNPPKTKNGTDMDIDESDIDAGSRAPKAKGKAKVVDDDGPAFEDDVPKKKAAPSGPKDASDQYQKVCSQCKASVERP
jgi:hypothetical protein